MTEKKRGDKAEVLRKKNLISARLERLALPLSLLFSLSFSRSFELSLSPRLESPARVPAARPQPRAAAWTEKKEEPARLRETKERRCKAGKASLDVSHDAKKNDQRAFSLFSLSLSLPLEVAASALVTLLLLLLLVAVLILPRALPGPRRPSGSSSQGSSSS